MNSNIELSISKDYVSHWTFYDAVREYLQNAIDQSKSNERSAMIHDYNVDTQTLTIGNKSTSLSIASLLLGHTSKNEDEFVGHFGEGYKLATLVMLREGKKVTIYNGNRKEIWRPFFANSRCYHSKVLAFNIEHVAHYSSDDLLIKIENVSLGEYNEIILRTLQLQNNLGDVINTSHGTILADPKFSSKIYLNGLYVMDCPALIYGYDMKSDKVNLGRDRDQISEFDVMWEASSMWTEGPTEMVTDLIFANIPDIRYIVKAVVMPSPTRFEGVAIKFYSEYGDNAFPVSSHGEFKRVLQIYKGVEPVIVPCVCRDAIKSTALYESTNYKKVSITRQDAFNEWLSNNMDKLHSSDIDELIKIFKMK